MIVSDNLNELDHLDNISSTSNHGISYGDEIIFDTFCKQFWMEWFLDFNKQSDSYLTLIYNSVEQVKHVAQTYLTITK